MFSFVPNFHVHCGDVQSLSEGYAVPEGPADPAVVTRVSAPNDSSERLYGLIRYAGYGDGSRPMISQLWVMMVDENPFTSCDATGISLRWHMGPGTVARVKEKAEPGDPWWLMVGEWLLVRIYNHLGVVDRIWKFQTSSNFSEDFLNFQKNLVDSASGWGLLGTGTVPSSSQDSSMFLNKWVPGMSENRVSRSLIVSHRVFPVKLRIFMGIPASIFRQPEMMESSPWCQGLWRLPASGAPRCNWCWKAWRQRGAAWSRHLLIGILKRLQ